MGINQLQYENDNTKNLINEIYHINPHIKFTTFGNVISEKEAIVLYRVALKNKDNKNTNLVYVPVLNI